jgi:hypothetical protein
MLGLQVDRSVSGFCSRQTTLFLGNPERGIIGFVTPSRICTKSRWFAQTVIMVWFGLREFKANGKRF